MWFDVIKINVTSVFMFKYRGLWWVTTSCRHIARQFLRIQSKSVFLANHYLFRGKLNILLVLHATLIQPTIQPCRSCKFLKNVHTKEWNSNPVFGRHGICVVDWSDRIDVKSVPIHDCRYMIWRFVMGGNHRANTLHVNCWKPIKFSLQTFRVNYLSHFAHDSWDIDSAHTWPFRSCKLLENLQTREWTGNPILIGIDSNVVVGCDEIDVTSVLINECRGLWWMKNIACQSWKNSSNFLRKGAHAKLKFGIHVLPQPSWSTKLSLVSSHFVCTTTIAEWQLRNLSWLLFFALHWLSVPWCALVLWPTLLLPTQTIINSKNAETLDEIHT